MYSVHRALFHIQRPPLKALLSSECAVWCYYSPAGIVRTHVLVPWGALPSMTFLQDYNCLPKADIFSLGLVVFVVVRLCVHVCACKRVCVCVCVPVHVSCSLRMSLVMQGSGEELPKNGDSWHRIRYGVCVRSCACV